MSRRERQHARQRIQKRVRRQEQEEAQSREPDECERDRLTAQHTRELYGRVNVGIGLPFYIRHLGLLDRTPSPISTREDEMPDVIRRSRA